MNSFAMVRGSICAGVWHGYGTGHLCHTRAGPGPGMARAFCAIPWGMARGSCAILWAGGPAGLLPGISCLAWEAKKARELTQSRATEPCAVVRYRATLMHDLAKAGRRYGTGMARVWFT